MSFINTIKNFFTTKPKQPKILVVFDGDQVSGSLYKKFADVKNDNIKHVWVQSGSIKPKHLGKSDVSFHVAPKLGKESADTLMAVLIGVELHNNNKIREVHVVSADGDTLDMCVSLAYEYNRINFFHLHSNTRPVKKAIRSFVKYLPDNCKFITIQGK